MSGIATLTEQVADLTAELEAACVAVGEGALVDLAGLDLRVAELCAQANSLPRDTAGVAGGHLLALVAVLERLSACLSAQSAEMTGAPPGPPQAKAAHGHAAGAYRKRPE